MALPRELIEAQGKMDAIGLNPDKWAWKCTKGEYENIRTYAKGVYNFELPENATNVKFLGFDIMAIG